MDVPPLLGFSVGVTADRRAAEQREMLERRGARVVHGPAIRTEPLAADAGIRAATERLVATPPTYLLVTTGIGVRSWFAAAESWGVGTELTDTLSAASILARGPKAAGAVITAGLTVDWRTPDETLRGLVDETMRRAPGGATVAVQLDGNQQQREVQRLRAGGFDVVEIRAYEWHPRSDAASTARLIDAVCDRRVDAVTFTSSAAVRTFVALADARGTGEPLRHALSGPVLAMCVGPVSAGVAGELGLRASNPERPRLGSMVHRLTDELAARCIALRLRDRDVVLRGATLITPDGVVTLTEQERRLLGILAERRGAVVGRQELARAAGAQSRGDHAVEVAVARLRQTLGDLGAGVVTIPRRGYRLVQD